MRNMRKKEEVPGQKADETSQIVREVREKPIDPGLAARLRELSEARVRQQIASAKQRATQQRDNRQEFARRRRVGLQERHALKQARQNLTNRHEQGDQP